MLEKKKVSFKSEKSKNTPGHGTIKLDAPDSSGLEINEEQEEETQDGDLSEWSKDLEQNAPRPFVSMFKNLFGMGTKQSESSSSSKGCGCF